MCHHWWKWHLYLHKLVLTRDISEESNQFMVNTHIPIECLYKSQAQSKSIMSTHTHTILSYGRVSSTLFHNKAKVNFIRTKLYLVLMTWSRRVRSDLTWPRHSDLCKPTEAELWSKLGRTWPRLMSKGQTCQIFESLWSSNASVWDNRVWPVRSQKPKISPKR